MVRKKKESKRAEELSKLEAKKKAAAFHRKTIEGLVENRELESIVFGNVFLGQSKTPAAEPQSEEPAVATPLPKKKRKAPAVKSDAESEEEEAEEAEAGASGAPPGKKKPAWVDPDDQELKVNLSARALTRKLRTKQAEEEITGQQYESLLRQEFVNLHGNKRWAEKQEEEDSSSSDESEAPAAPAPASSARLGKKKASTFLPPGELDIKRVKEVQLVQGESEGPCVIKACQFHPDSSILFTAGLDKKVRLYAVDGEENPKVSSYYFDKIRIEAASFLPGGNSILVKDMRHLMWSLDIHTGQAQEVKPFAGQLHKRYRCLTVGPHPADAPDLRISSMYTLFGDSGAVMVLDSATHHPIRTLRMSAEGTAAAFAPDSDTLYTADSESNIYEWDLGTGRCKQRAKESWATGITSLAVRRTGARAPQPLLAVGTVSGNIDIFDISEGKLPAEPTHSIDNLTTAVAGVAFHPQGEMLAGWSDKKRDSLKLFHTQTMTAFQNWPIGATEHRRGTPLQKVTALDFARSGGMMACGNERGQVLLFQLQHYEGHVAA